MVGIVSETAVGAVAGSGRGGSSSVGIPKGGLIVVSEGCGVGIGASGGAVILSYYIDSSVVLPYIVRYAVVIVVIHIFAIVVTIVSVISAVSVVRLRRIIIPVVVIAIIIWAIVVCITISVRNTRG